MESIHGPFPFDRFPENRQNLRTDDKTSVTKPAGFVKKACPVIKNRDGRYESAPRHMSGRIAESRKETTRAKTAHGIR